MYTGATKLNRGKYKYRGFLIVKQNDVWRVYEEGGMSPALSESFQLKCLAINAIDKFKEEA